MSLCFSICDGIEWQIWKYEGGGLFFFFPLICFPLSTLNVQLWTWSAFALKSTFAPCPPPPPKIPTVVLTMREGEVSSRWVLQKLYFQFILGSDKDQRKILAFGQCKCTLEHTSVWLLCRFEMLGAFQVYLHCFRRKKNAKNECRNYSFKVYTRFGIV